MIDVENKSSHNDRELRQRVGSDSVGMIVQSPGRVILLFRLRLPTYDRPCEGLGSSDPRQ
jgi:hypothetical protein